MNDYTEILLRKFPTDPRLGFYARPNMPPNKLGKVLSTFSRLNVADVVAFHQYGGMFSSGVAAFTKDMCYYDKGYFKLEDVISSFSSKDTVQVSINQSGASVTHVLKAENEQAAQMLSNVFDALAAKPKADDVAVAKADYSQYSATSLDWLELRDEVIRTIDLLAQRYEDGKLTLIEYEEKKADLLSRL